MAAVFRTRTPSETEGFMKALIDTESDRILGFTVFGVNGGEIMGAVQIAMNAGMPYTAARHHSDSPDLVRGIHSAVLICAVDFQAIGRTRITGSS